jgi:DNA-binding SARP family transcriptional activator
MQRGGRWDGARTDDESPRGTLQHVLPPTTPQRRRIMDPVYPALVRVRLLGGLEVEGVKSSELGSQKGRTILKVLALAHPGLVSIDTLVTAAWPDRPPAEPAREISVLVSRLRRALGPWRVPYADHSYRLTLDWLDLAEFRELASRAALHADEARPAEALAASLSALKLFRGPLLPADFGADWADLERAFADRLVTEVMETAAMSAMAIGNVRTAVEMAGAALARDPLDEFALRLLMTALGSAGRPGAALEAYHLTRSRLREDLGIEPAPQTQAAYLAILHQQPIASGALNPATAQQPAVPRVKPTSAT